MNRLPTFRTGWEALSGSYFPITAHKKEGKEEVSPVLRGGRWRGGGEGKNEKLKMREGWEEPAFFLLIRRLVLDKAFEEENAMFGFSNT